MPELNNDEKDTIGNEQKPKNRKISMVKDNYTVHSSFDDEDTVFTDIPTKMTSRKEGEILNKQRRLVVMKPNNQIKELQTVIWNR